MKKITFVILLLVFALTGIVNAQNATNVSETQQGTVSQTTQVQSQASTQTSNNLPVAVPIGKTIVVNPIESTPIKVEGTATSVAPATSATSGGAVPTITTQVSIDSKEQKIEISSNTETKEAQISIAGGVSASTTTAVTIEDSKLYMQTSVGPQEVKVSPTEASTKVSEAAPATTVNEIKLEEKSQAPVYSVSATREAKIFFFIPVSVFMETQVNAQTGEIVSVQKPWWSFLAW